MTKEIEHLKKLLKVRDEEIEHLSGWLLEFARIEDKEFDGEVDIWLDDELQETCTNLESRLDAAEMNVQILEGKNTGLMKIIAAQDKLINIYEKNRSVTIPDF
ncbi:hypothetical protein ACMG4J_02480 [Rossellomorea marisflavi]|uniref:hypothetical protein n=1 Tax=Rossellomorea marisflavi TaxID=189381 RepID=UPI0039BFD1F9